MSKILYVDDDADNLLIFEALCAGRFDALTADNGEEALRILAREEVGVLLADQRMPGMTGVELAERASHEHPDVVRILITAYTDLSEAIDAINRGKIRGYLRKPWVQEELLATLKESLATFATRKRVRDLELHMLATERVYTLGVVTAGIAHDLKSPLLALSDGCLVLHDRMRQLRESIVNGDTERALRRLDAVMPFVEAQRDSTAAMVDTCRGFEVANYEVDPHESCELEEVVGTATRIALASRDGLTPLRVDVPKTLEVIGNRYRLGRVIINLLVNAFDAVSDTEDGEVRLRAREDAGSVLVEVEDNGPGLDAQTQARIFDVFFSTKERSGTGLGLAMSRKIVEEVGGTLSCVSKPGQGAIFKMRLQACDRHERDD